MIHRPIIAISAIVAAIGLFSPSMTRAASFDCLQAREGAERMICADPILSELDDQLSEAYKIAVDRGYSAATSAKQQLWVAKRNRCRDVACLANLYRDRIAELKQRATLSDLPPFFYAPTGAVAPAPSPSTTAQATPSIDVAPLPDRTVWEGRYRCGQEPIVANLVIFGSPKQADEAYFIINKDETVHTIAFVGHVVVKYSLYYDNILDELKLTSPKIIVQDTNPLLARQLDLALENQEQMIRGRIDASCDAFTLGRKVYPKPISQTLAATQGRPDSAPPVTLANASSVGDPDLFCVVLSAWAKRLRANAPNHNYDQPIRNDESARIFRASVFHPAFAMPYAGRDFSALPAPRDAYSVLQVMKTCFTNPLSFESQDIFHHVFYDGLNYPDDLRRDGEKLRDLAARAARLGQAADRFSPDAGGLAKLNGYIDPMEAELVSAVSETRNAILSPAWRRQIEIATVILQNVSDQSAQTMSLEELQSVDSSARIVQAHADLLPAGRPVLRRAEAMIGDRLQTLLAADIEPVQDAPATVDGLIELKARQFAAAGKFAGFSAYPAYQAIMSGVDFRVAAMERDVAQGLARQMTDAPDAVTLGKIRSSLEILEGAEGNPQFTAALWAEYRRRLAERLQTAGDKSSAPQEPTNPPPANADMRPPLPDSSAGRVDFSPGATESGSAPSPDSRHFAPKASTPDQ